MLNHIRDPIPLEKITFIDDDEFRGIDVVDENMSLVSHIIQEEFIIMSISLGLKTLSEREKEIIFLRFGLDDDKKKTLEEVGEMLEVTRERVRQIESDALQKLQNYLRTLR